MNNFVFVMYLNLLMYLNFVQMDLYHLYKLLQDDLPLLLK